MSSLERAEYIGEWMNDLPSSEQLEKTYSSGRLIETTKLFEKFFDVKISGEENLRLIPPGAKVIFAPSHITDFDVPISVAAIGEFRKNLKLANESSHYNFFKKPGPYLGMKQAGGKENFRPVHHYGGKLSISEKAERFVKGEPLTSPKRRVGNFRKWVSSESYEQLEKDLDEGNDVIMTAYFDPAYAGNQQELSERKGIGAVYLAERTGAVVVPIAVDAEMEEKVGLGNFDIVGYLKEYIKNKGHKPRVNVNIGRPMQIERAEGIDDMVQVLEGHDLEKFRKLRAQLEDQSAQVMGSIAEMLPENKRGAWKGSQETTAAA